MSSIDQAFVKAFARRSRPTRNASHTDAGTSIPADQDVSELPGDPAEAPTAQVWIDPISDRVLRADFAAEDTVPDPHHVPAAAPIKPWEHFRCDYVFGAVKEVLPAEKDGATEGDGEVEIVEVENSVVDNEAEIVDAGNAVSDSDVEVTDAEITVAEDAVAQQTVAEPTVSEPTVSEPTVSEPTVSEPTVSEPTVSEPTVAEPTVSEPTVSEPTVSEPTVAEPTVAEDAEDETLPGISEEPVAAKAQPKEIQAAWEVDMFEVPSTTADLFFDEEFFQGIANHMRDAVDNGLSSLVVTSAHAGEGRSTVAIGIAITAAATGLKVALVDGDTEDPTLADDLRLDLEHGWVETIRNGQPIDQVAVQSIQDGVTLFPLIPGKANTRGATAAEVEQLMQTLTDRFDLIVVDGPSGTMPRIHKFAALVDTAIITRDPSRTDEEKIDELSQRLRDAGVKGVGIVENFK